MTAADRTTVRQRSERAGRRSERLAAIVMQLKGYRLLARRYRTHGGEIDLICRRGTIVAFIEVKRRKKIETAIDAVSFRARRRIEKAADMFIAQKAHLAECDMRYDIVAIAPWRFRHLRNAWRFGE